MSSVYIPSVYFIEAVLDMSKWDLDDAGGPGDYDRPRLGRDSDIVE